MHAKTRLACQAKSANLISSARVAARSIPLVSRPIVRRSKVSPKHTVAATPALAAAAAALPPETLAIGAAAVVLLGSAAFMLSNQKTASAAGQDESPDAVVADVTRENAVVVFGAAGRLGRLIVQQLLASGRTVVAAVRSMDKAHGVFQEMGLAVGPVGTTGGTMVLRKGAGSGPRVLRQASGGTLVLQQVDVTDKEALGEDLFQGVSQVVVALGPVFGRTPEGGMGYLDGMTSERVEEQGVANIVEAFSTFVPKQESERTVVLGMSTEEDLAVWERLDDVIMGGQSQSGLAPSGDGSGAVWKGDLIVEGGGFCGARSKKLDLDLSKYDGISLRVKGDGQTFKLNIKTVDQEDIPESTYQATFDTDASGGWTDVEIPWHNFVPVTRAQSDPTGGPLDASKISKMGLVLSRFEFNKMPNPDYKAGPFQLEIQGGVKAFKKARPQLVMVSSAGVERNAIVGDDAEKRALEIPIVRLNPGGTLNHKYAGENAVRASGYPYTVIRPTGMSDSAEDGPALLEADQGDCIVGVVTRGEVAGVIDAALKLPEAAGKTFELRRNAAADAKGVEMTDKRHLRLFLKLALDKHRWRVGLGPFPKAVPPPAPVSEEVRQKVLSDPVVQAVAARDRAARAKDEALAAQKEKATVGA